MYGYPPYPPPPYYPPQSGVIYVPVPQQPAPKGKGGGRKGWKNPPPPLDPLASIAKAKEDIEKLEKWFKKEEKKDDKPKESFMAKKQFTFMEAVAFNFIFWLPTSLLIFGALNLVRKLSGL